MSGVERASGYIPSVVNKQQEKKETNSTQDKKEQQSKPAGAAKEQDIFAEVQPYDDDTKYQTAVMMAQRNLADKGGDLDEYMLKDEIDRLYSQMGGTKSAREMRGETGWNGMIADLDRAINTATLGLGEGANWLFDNTIGNIAGLAGDEAKQAVQGMFDGRDLQGLADMGIDVGLAALGPAGWAAAIGKNAIQQSDNFAEAISGKDAITLEDLSDNDRLGSGFEAVLGTGLSALPSGGKYVGGAIADTFGKAAKNVATEGAEQAAKRGGFRGALDEIAESRNNAKAIKEARRTNATAGKEIVKEPDAIDVRPTTEILSDAAKGISPKGFGGRIKQYGTDVATYADMATPLTKTGRDMGKLIRQDARSSLKNLMPGQKAQNAARTRAFNDYLNRATEAVQKDDSKVAQLATKAQNAAHPILGMMMPVVGGTAGTLASIAGSGGENLDDMPEWGMPQIMAAATGMMAPKKNMVGLTGRMSRMIPSLALSTNEAMKQQSRLADDLDVGTDIYNINDILAALQAAKG